MQCFLLSFGHIVIYHSEQNQKTKIKEFDLKNFDWRNDTLDFSILGRKTYLLVNNKLTFNYKIRNMM